MINFADYESTTIISAILLGSSILTGLAALTKDGRILSKKLWGAIKRPFMLVSQLKRHDEHLKQTDIKLDSIEHKVDSVLLELQVNGGSSLKDMLNVMFIDQLAEIGSRRAMFTSTLAFWESDKDGQCTFASDKLAEYVDQNPHDVLGSGWLTTVHPDDVDRVAKTWEFAVRQRRAFICDYRFVHANGDIVTVQGHCHPVLNTKREIVKFIGILTKKLGAVPVNCPLQDDCNQLIHTTGK
jgi:PAS domain S-box-containing protein